ncbi:MAG: 3-dehydroquinate synthase [Lachnospiraceae bacterium]|nr:3-dehydroquinate synthase [Lachnospiraceae bacterium]
MEKIHVSASGSYDILIEDGILEKTGAYLKDIIKGRKAVLVTDDIVDGLYSGKVSKSLEEAGFQVLKFVIPNGEASKNAGNFIKLLEYAAENKVSRADVMVALGGGVVGDLTGFAAASFLRGIAFVQLPTTLLAAVDSSVGGKTAIDLVAGKNLVGAFYQPKLVLCDITTFNTLPEEIFADGMAEVIKYGAIVDKELWDWLKEPLGHDEIEKIVARCVSIKRDVVEKDEFDTGLRQILNFGHTIGHSIETLSNYTISHGKAVAIGMSLASAISVQNGFCKDALLVDEMNGMLTRHKLPINTEFDAVSLIEPIRSDKKGDGAGVNLILLEKIGQYIIKKVSFDDICDMLSKVIKERV